MKQKIRNLDMDTVFATPAAELQLILGQHLSERKKKVFQGSEFVYAPGKLPVLLVAHMDTVHKYSPTICKSEDGAIWMAPEGIGGDDRAGIWIILNALEKFDCHVLFTQGEEVGGIGASAFRKSGHYPKVNFLIQVDRRGFEDAVFYDCGNEDFISFVCDTTLYKESIGSFSDISILAPWLDRAAVNLSAGYYNEHTKYEYVDLRDMDDTLQAVCSLLESDRVHELFKFKEVAWVPKPSKGSSAFRGKWTSAAWDEYAWEDYYGGYGSYGTKTSTTSYPPAPKKTPAPVPAATTVFVDDEDEESISFYQEMFQRAIDTCLYDILGYVPDKATAKAAFYAIEDLLFDGGYLPV